MWSRIQKTNSSSLIQLEAPCTESSFIQSIYFIRLRLKCVYDIVMCRWEKKEEKNKNSHAREVSPVLLEPSNFNNNIDSKSPSQTFKEEMFWA